VSKVTDVLRTAQFSSRVVDLAAQSAHFVAKERGLRLAPLIDCWSGSATSITFTQSRGHQAFDDIHLCC